jgi:DNA-binding transcriptional LysR family regulator
VIDIRNLETFSCAAENKSISEAARRLHVSQPAVTHRIKVLEREIGAPLFIRGNLGLELTETGRFVLPWVQRLIHDTHNLAQMLASMQKDIVGELRIACSTTVGKYVLPQLASRFCLSYPDIRARILACRPEHATLDLLQGEAHIGVLSSETSDPSLEAQEFFRDTITLIVPASHRWASRNSIEPQELLEEPMILREETSGTRRVLLAELTRHDISLDDLNIFIEIGNAEAIVRTVAAGYAISFVSKQASVCLVERGDIVEIPVDGLSLRRTIYMLRKRNSRPHRPRDVFWGFIHDPGNADILNLASCKPMTNRD